ncbi:MAG: N-acetyltransferase family protein, partial [Halobacteriota archaeon]
MDLSEAVTVRDARLDDHDDVREMTADTWPGRQGGDYLGRVFPRWIEPGARPKRTLVAEVDGRAVAIAQCVLLSDVEGWGQGLRVHPSYRRRGLSRAVTAALFDWAREQGATVMRAMVFSWNVAGLGQARSTGYRP